MKLKIKIVLRNWLPIAIVTIILSALIYLSLQQNLRLLANDPQIQIAEDSARLLLNGKNAQEIVGQTQVDISKSLALFIIVFDELGKPVVSQAVLDGRIPTPPPGVFTYTKQHKQNKITWQPKPRIRLATILMHFEGANPGFVLVGRSLREVENRQSYLALQVALMSALALAGSFITVLFASNKQVI